MLLHIGLLGTGFQSALFYMLWGMCVHACVHVCIHVCGVYVVRVRVHACVHVLVRVCTVCTCMHAYVYMCGVCVCIGQMTILSIISQALFTVLFLF